MKVCAQEAKDSSKSPLLDTSGNTTPMFYHINELISQCVQGVIKHDLVVNTLQELVSLHKDVPAIILDVLNIVDAETSDAGSGDGTKTRNNFCQLVKDCDKVLSDKLLKERLEIDTLQEVGVLKNRSFYTKFIKVKTKL